MEESLLTGVSSWKRELFPSGWRNQTPNERDKEIKSCTDRVLWGVEHSGLSCPLMQPCSNQEYLIYFCYGSCHGSGGWSAHVVIHEYITYSCTERLYIRMNLILRPSQLFQHCTRKVKSAVCNIEKFGMGLGGRLTLSAF